MRDFNEAKVNRQASGTSAGGQFANKDHPANDEVLLGGGEEELVTAPPELVDLFSDIMERRQVKVDQSTIKWFADTMYAKLAANEDVQDMFANNSLNQVKTSRYYQQHVFDAIVETAEDAKTMRDETLNEDSLQLIKEESAADLSALRAQTANRPH